MYNINFNVYCHITLIGKEWIALCTDEITHFDSPITGNFSTNIVTRFCIR